ncbi:MAG TPA: TetR/AcrR family transcriptional regulator [Candidatus Cybelea sp.]|nr:TetR/AcrR family transcriptional regulator [Candidatus Cybelea sp.]
MTVQQSTDKAEMILGAALELFEAQGFDGTAVPELARKAGVGTGTIYRYFATKEALLNALYQRWKGAYNDAVLAPFEPGLSIRARFGLYWRRMTGFARSESRAVRFMEMHHHASYLDARSREMTERYLATATAFIDEGVREGVLKQLPPQLAAALMWGALIGLMKMYPNLDDMVVAQVEECLWDGIRRH